jgi:hypothetical protein
MLINVKLGPRRPFPTWEGSRAIDLSFHSVRFSPKKKKDSVTFPPFNWEKKGSFSSLMLPIFQSFRTKHLVSDYP